MKIAALSFSWEAGRSVSEIELICIAIPLRSTESIRRNRHHDVHPPFRCYFPTMAHGKAAARRVRGAKVARDPRLAAYIVDRLAAAWSPEQIAG
ncbi:hypothetical protein C1T17_13480 [Sphingobium sp. SCG-1]|uniref:hypothetical protein n=1 Tax=Sphingobium sp. SCG-1 TaxID=2072936 RepID=UPI000CD6A436|nr:hypothetical protein [Sphingobium sp. SCG-1]AUW58952.1 hypothetical protein C1T17_13480 [Sphingobium sp. SCG-1]